MAPKKDKKKDAKAAKSGTVFTEVERTFLELQLAECNRKVARLRTAVNDYEQRNEELQQAYDKLDEDRADIIAYLKKQLNSKNEENSELKEKVKGLEETREIETAEFREKVAELEKNFTTMKDQLTSENKLLAGKLNTLEEFRAIRDDLMRKFDKQEQAFKDQEMRYKRIVYEAEKKFVIGKDKLKKEMEARLLKLAQDFQDATELRIAASTHRVIRENIAINNELDNILSTQAKLAEQNEKFKENERDARVAKELAEEERDKAINKNVIQLKVIDQLTNAFEEVKKERAIYKKKTFDLETLQGKIKDLTKENESLLLRVHILEQNLHARLSDQNKATVESSKVAIEAHKLKRILKEAAFAIQAALKLDQWATTDPEREIMSRSGLLTQLLDIVTQYRVIQQAESTDTVASFGIIYEKGDLGFIPKVTSRKKSALAAPLLPTSRDKEPASLQKEKRSSETASVSSSSIGSVKTIPSMQIIPVSSKPQIAPKDSLESFITSTQSTTSTEESGKEEQVDIMDQLEASKLEIQKSIMKDLAYSQVSYQSKLRLSDEVRNSRTSDIGHRTSKSVHIDTSESGKKLIDEEGEKIGEQIEGEHLEVTEGEERVEDEEEKKKKVSIESDIITADPPNE